MITDNKKDLNSSIFNIPLTKIIPNPFQPRISFDDSSLSALADSITRYGVLQPIVVTRKIDDKGEEFYELIAGERRYRASKIAGLSHIPAVVKSVAPSDEEKFELAIIENLQREDLNPVDKARAFSKLSREFGLTHGDIATRMGKSREYVSNSLRLLTLPDEILGSLSAGEISEAHARPLLMLKDRIFEQKELLQKIITDKLTVRESEKIARRVLAGKTIGKYKQPSKHNLKSIETKLAEKFGTKVKVSSSDDGSGKVTIDFFSDEDLNKILDLVNGTSSFSEIETKEDQEYNNEINLDKAVRASVLENEINSLSNHEMKIEPEPKEIKNTVKDEVIDNITREEDTSGYNINFGAPKIEEKVLTGEEVSTEDIHNFDFTNEDIHNFSNDKLVLEQETIKDVEMQMDVNNNVIKEVNEDIKENNPVDFIQKQEQNIPNFSQPEPIFKENIATPVVNNIDHDNLDLNTEKEPQVNSEDVNNFKIQEDIIDNSFENINETNTNIISHKVNEELDNQEQGFNLNQPISDNGVEVSSISDSIPEGFIPEGFAGDSVSANIKQDISRETVDSIEYADNEEVQDSYSGVSAPGDSIYEEFLKSKQKTQDFKEKIVKNQKEESFSEQTGDFMAQSASSHHSHIKNQTQFEYDNLERLRREALGLDPAPTGSGSNTTNNDALKNDGINNFSL